MRATAHIVAMAGPGGDTQLMRLSGQPPLLPRRTGVGAGAEAEVHLVGGAAGPLGGDRLRLKIEVGPGARLCLRTVAAAIALPGRARSRLEIRASVAAGGRLTWLPEPLIAAAGCDHESTSTVELADGATLLWREEVVCGRHGEPSGAATLSTRVELAGRTLHHQSLSVGPGAPGWDGPAGLDDGRAAGTLLVVDPRWVDAGPPGPVSLSPTAALMPLAGPAALISAVGTIASVRRAMAQAKLTDVSL